MFSPKNARQWFLIHYNAMFSHAYNNKIGICIKVQLSKTFISGYRIVIVSVTLKKAKMAQFWGKGRILHVSYLLNEFGEPTFFPFVTMCMLIIKFTCGKFQQIFISTTITDELP